MREEINGESVRCTGDINLVAAIMAQGVPLAQDCPVAILESEDGHSYGSFRLCQFSTDQKIATEHLMETWNGERTLALEHGFSKVCAFIRARPRGVQSSPDLLDFAVTWLSEKGIALPGLTRFADIPRFVMALPESEAAYVLAYVWNRDICFQLYKSAARKIYQSEGSGSDMRRALIDTALPKWKRTELLSRLQG